MSACKRCGKPIAWGFERDGNGKRRWIPLDANPDPLGVYELKPDKAVVFAGTTQDPAAVRYMPHEANCSAPYRPNRPRPHLTKENAT